VAIGSNAKLLINARKRKRCENSVNPLESTWFGSRCRLSFTVMLQLTFCFVRGYKLTDAVEEFRINIKKAVDLLFLVGRYAICLRDMAGKKIGGQNKTVEVDEAHLCTRKYSVG